MTAGRNLLPIHIVPALAYEIDAAASLLHCGLKLVRDFRTISLDADPLFSCLALGVEKVTKLTLGLSAYADNGSWPSMQTMRNNYGHHVVDLDQSCRDYFASHVDRSPSGPYLMTLLEQVATDTQIHLVLAALDRYGSKGRFFNLDALAEAPQLEPSPRELWEHVERSVWDGNADIISKIGTPKFEEAAQEVNGHIEAAIRRWCELYYRCWINGVAGSYAQQWCAPLAPR